MTVVPPKLESSLARRGDRLHEAPSGRNAQGLFLPSACIFVGNLSTKVPSGQLAEDLKTAFERFGPCWPKIKQGKKKDLPGAFVQFERPEDASSALACEQALVLHGRPLRVEPIKGRRTAILGLRSGGLITEADISLALGGRGPLEGRCMEHHFVHPHGWMDVCKVTFVFVDDCRDAVNFFSHHDIFFMKMFDQDQGPTGRGRPPTAPMPPRNGNSQGRWFGSRPQRGGPARNRGGYRAYPKFRPPPFAPENIPSYHSPPFMAAGMPYSENHPPFYPPPASAPLPPHSNAGYATPPFVMNGLPAYTGAPFIQHSPTYAPPVNCGPFIVNSQPVYGPITPPYYGEQFHPDHGYFGPQPHMNIHPGGYFPPTPTTPAYYGESFPQNPPYFTPPEFDNKLTSPSTESSTVKDTETNKETTERDEPAKSPELEIPPKAEEQKLEEPKDEEPKAQESTEEVDIFNLPNSQEPPKLIRICDSDSDSEEDDEGEEKPLPRRRRSNSLQDSLEAWGLETVKEEPEEDETADDTTTLESASNSDSDSARETRSRKVTRTRAMKYGPNKERRVSSNSPPSVSRSGSRTRKPLAPEYEPVHGTTIEKYVRDMANGLGEPDIQAIIRELEEEWLKKGLQEKFIESGSSARSRSRSDSVATTSSYKSL